MLHAVHISARMRRADIDEVMASGGHDPMTALRESLDSAAKAWTALVNDEPGCMFGVTALDILSGLGCPWLLGTNLVEKNSIAFLRRSKRYVAEMLDLFPYLYNFVDARNRLSIRWLKWCGFDFAKTPKPYGVAQLPFYRFEMRRV